MLTVLTALAVLMAACMWSVSEWKRFHHNVRKAFRRSNINKAAGPEGISGWVL